MLINTTSAIFDFSSTELWLGLGLQVLHQGKKLSFAAEHAELYWDKFQ